MLNDLFLYLKLSVFLRVVFRFMGHLITKQPEDEQVYGGEIGEK